MKEPLLPMTIEKRVITYDTSCNKCVYCYIFSVCLIVVVSIGMLVWCFVTPSVFNGQE